MDLYQISSYKNYTKELVK